MRNAVRPLKKVPADRKDRLAEVTRIQVESPACRLPSRDRTRYEQPHLLDLGGHEIVIQHWVVKLSHHGIGDIECPPLLEIGGHRRSVPSEREASVAGQHSES